MQSCYSPLACRFDRCDPEMMSKTNVYIRGLRQATTEETLHNMCAQFGRIVSSKVILDHLTKKCKGYGFVDFQYPADAERAIRELPKYGVHAQLAKAGLWPAQREEDPTNLYLANLPQNFTETEMMNMLSKYGIVISIRILYDMNMNSRGVGFARMDNHQQCQSIIQKFNGNCIEGSNEPLIVKFADGGPKHKAYFENFLYSPNMQQNAVRNMEQPPTAVPYSPYVAPQMGAYSMPMPGSQWMPNYSMSYQQPPMEEYYRQMTAAAAVTPAVPVGYSDTSLQPYSGSMMQMNAINTVYAQPMSMPGMPNAEVEPVSMASTIDEQFIQPEASSE